MYICEPLHKMVKYIVEIWIKISHNTSQKNRIFSDTIPFELFSYRENFDNYCFVNDRKALRKNRKIFR